MLHNWPHLYQNAVVDVSDLGERKAKDQGGFYDVSDAVAAGQRQVARPALRDRGQRRRLPQVVVRGGRRHQPPEDAGRVRARSAPRSRRRASRSARPSATPSATRRPSPTPSCGPSAAPRPTTAGKKVVLNCKGAVEAVKWMHAFWKDACDEGGARLGRHQQQPRLPRRRALRHAQRRLASTSSPSATRTRSRTRRASRCGGTSTTSRFPPAPPARPRCTWSSPTRS